MKKGVAKNLIFDIKFDIHVLYTVQSLTNNISHAFQIFTKSLNAKHFTINDRTFEILNFVGRPDTRMQPSYFVAIYERVILQINND